MHEVPQFLTHEKKPRGNKRLYRQERDPLAKLSKVLTDHAHSLEDEAERHWEQKVRSELLSVYGSLGTSEKEMGRWLIELRTIYKQRRYWTLILEDIAKAIRRHTKTLRRWMERYEYSQQPAPTPRPDLPEKTSPEEDDFLAKAKDELHVRSRLLMKSLKGVPATDIPDVLQKMLLKNAKPLGFASDVDISVTVVKKQETLYTLAKAA